MRSLLGLIALCAPLGLALGQEKQGPEKWEPAIARFEKQDAEQAPPKNAILFVGSSSIRLWKLDMHFPDRPVINRGFGGSEISDSIHFAPRIILKHEPRIVVLYAGDNDLAKGKSPERVGKDFATFVRTVHQELPKTRILFIAIKPSIKRWNLIDKVRKANAMIRAQCEKSELLTYLDIDTPMIGKDGKPRAELFVKDGLHLNEKGYELWSAIVRKELK